MCRSRRWCRRSMAICARSLIDAQRASMEQRPGDPIAMRPLREERRRGARVGQRHHPRHRMRSRGQHDRGDRERRMDSQLAGDRCARLPAGIADADFFPRREASQRAQAGEASAHHAVALARDARRRAVPRIRHARWRSAGSMDAAIFPQRDRFRDGLAAGDRGAEIFQRAFPLDVLSAWHAPRRAADRGAHRRKSAASSSKLAATASRCDRRGRRATCSRSSSIAIAACCAADAILAASKCPMPAATIGW